MASVTLVPMSPERYITWRAYSVASYAEENVTSGRWTEDEALDESPRRTFKRCCQMASTLPATSCGQSLTRPATRQGSCGWPPTAGPGYAFIYDIEMDPDRRGQGFGTATLLALDNWCRANGIATIGLHVFGHNKGAWELYKRMGYVETSVQMEKHV